MTNFYVITLESTPQRTQRAREEFQKAGIDPVWVWGIDAIAFGIKPHFPMHMYPDGTTPYHITPGATGLVLSHYMALRMAERDGVDDFVICEDDVILGDDFLEKFAKVRENALAVNSLACWLEWCCMEYPNQERYGGPLLRFGLPLCTAAVWYQKAAIPKVIKAIQPAQAPVDIMIRHNSEGLNATFTYPQLCHQVKYNDTENSTIHRQLPDKPEKYID